MSSRNPPPRIEAQAKDLRPPYKGEELLACYRDRIDAFVSRFNDVLKRWPGGVGFLGSDRVKIRHWIENYICRECVPPTGVHRLFIHTPFTRDVDFSDL